CKRRRSQRWTRPLTTRRMPRCQIQSQHCGTSTWRISEMAEKTMIEAVHDAMYDEMKRDERIVIMGEDVGEGGVFRATEGLQKEFGENRVMDTPLAEAAIVGVALGASLNGILPVAEIQFADFIHPAFDQIVSEVARLHYRSNGTWTCPVTIRTPY